MNTEDLDILSLRIFYFSTPFGLQHHHFGVRNLQRAWKKMLNSNIFPRVTILKVKQ